LDRENVDQSSCDVQEKDGYVERKMKLNATGEMVMERITINEELRETTFNKCLAIGQPGSQERVLAIHTGPLRMEFFERSTVGLMRVNWTAPASIARTTFENIVRMAKKLESKSADVIGFGLASKPMSGMTQDSLWKAMLFCVRNPDKCGMKVDTVRVKDVPGYMSNPGYLQRSMRLLEKPGSPMVTDNIRVLENALEITYRPVDGAVESQEERVFALRSNPLRCELFCRNSKTEMRIDWQAPSAVGNEIFNSVALACA